MSDDARRALSDEERARIQAARIRGGMCAVCGRELDASEQVWIRRIRLRDEHGHAATWRVPAGAECAAPDLRRMTDGMAPELCLTCARGVYYEAGGQPRGRTFCSRACSRRYQAARAKEARGS